MVKDSDKAGVDLAALRSNRCSHTPGPWFVGNDAALDCPDHANSGLALVDTGRSSDWPIARLCEWNNAKLIAAAPELLEALRELVSAEEEYGDPANAAVNEKWLKAKQLLAKL